MVIDSCILIGGDVGFVSGKYYFHVEAFARL